jgi:tRNA C32,U32 (ribose-2'-O)-methylase TrmJ
MSQLNIITDKNKKSLIQNIHIIFNKTNFTDNEVNLYLGILSKIEKALKK